MKDYFVIQCAHIGIEHRTLTVRTSAGVVRRIPLDDVSGLHLLAGYTMSDSVIRAATGASFPIHFYSYTGRYEATLDTRPAAEQAAPLLRQLESIQDPRRRVAIATTILNTSRTTLASALAKAGVATELPDATGETVEELRLTEARIRKEYYARLDVVLHDEWKIVTRNRRPPRRPADALLGFANGIVYAKTAGWIRRAGLDPRLGYLHGETRAPNPLALDLADLVKPHLSDAALLHASATWNARLLTDTSGAGTFLNEAGRKNVVSFVEEKLHAPVGEGGDLARLLQRIPVALHHALSNETPLEFPRIPCT